MKYIVIIVFIIFYLHTIETTCDSQNVKNLFKCDHLYAWCFNLQQDHELFCYCFQRYINCLLNISSDCYNRGSVNKTCYIKCNDLSHYCNWFLHTSNDTTTLALDTVTEMDDKFPVKELSIILLIIMLIVFFLSSLCYYRITNKTTLY